MFGSMVWAAVVLESTGLAGVCAHIKGSLLAIFFLKQKNKRSFEKCMRLEMELKSKQDILFPYPLICKSSLAVVLCICSVRSGTESTC